MHAAFLLINARQEDWLGLVIPARSGPGGVDPAEQKLMVRPEPVRAAKPRTQLILA